MKEFILCLNNIGWVRRRKSALQRWWLRKIAQYLQCVFFTVSRIKRVRCSQQYHNTGSQYRFMVSKQSVIAIMLYCRILFNWNTLNAYNKAAIRANWKRRIFYWRWASTKKWRAMPYDWVWVVKLRNHKSIELLRISERAYMALFSHRLFFPLFYSIFYYV